MSEEQKKDLSGLLESSEPFTPSADSAHEVFLEEVPIEKIDTFGALSLTPPEDVAPGEGNSIEDQPHEKIETFDALEEYVPTQSHEVSASAVEVGSTGAVDENQFLPGIGEAHVSQSDHPLANDPFAFDFSDQGSDSDRDPLAPASPEIEEPHSPGIPEINPDHSEIAPSPSSPEIEPQTPGPEISPGSNPPNEYEPPPGEGSDFAAVPSFSMDSPSTSPSPRPSTPELTPTPRKTPPAALDNIKKFSENIAPSSPPVPAAYPFTVRIRGLLSTLERDHLLALLARENMGIRELDLGNQFESGQVLLPRISEYAAVLIVQLLRESQATLEVLPSDEYADGTPNTFKSTFTNPSSHPAENIPVLTEAPPFNHDFLRESPDLITASEILFTHDLETERSTAFQELLDSLQRELKYKAYRKGAKAIVHFRTHLIPLSNPRQFRLLVTGSALNSVVPVTVQNEVENEAPF